VEAQKEREREKRKTEKRKTEKRRQSEEHNDRKTESKSKMCHFFPLLFIHILSKEKLFLKIEMMK
jgi:hypothetical protein